MGYKFEVGQKVKVGHESLKDIEVSGTVTKRKTAPNGGNEYTVDEGGGKTRLWAECHLTAAPSVAVTKKGGSK